MLISKSSFSSRIWGERVGPFSIFGKGGECRAKLERNTSMKYPVASRILLGILLLSLVFWAGCGTTKRLYSKARPGVNSGLKKRILLLPFMDQAGVGAVRVREMKTRFISLLNKDKEFLVTEGSQQAISTARIKSPVFGIAVDPEQVKKAREMGMNALVTVVLPPYELYAKKAGIWPFRRIKRKLEIAVVVNAFDVTNGTLFLTKLESRKIRLPNLDEMDLEALEPSAYEKRLEKQFDKSEIDEKKLAKALKQIVKSQASALREALVEQPWAGRILSTDSGSIIIDAGKDVGLRQGFVFEVFGRGEPITCADGRTLYPLGQKVGEIKVRQVRARSSLAIPLQGGPFAHGQEIRPKG